VCEQLRDELKADLFLGSDGPGFPPIVPPYFRLPRRNTDSSRRQSARTVRIIRQLGRVLANPATILASAIATLVEWQGTSAAGRIETAAHSNQIRSASPT